jgi:hypothetical protein
MRSGPDLAPVVVVLAPRQAVMQVDEVENLVEPVGDDAVVAERERFHVAVVREMLGEHDRGQVAEIQPG